MVISWQEVRWLQQIRQNLIAKLIQFFKVLVVWHVVRYCSWAELGPFFSLMPAADVLFSASHWFAEHIPQMLWFHQDPKSFSASDWQQITKQIMTPPSLFLLLLLLLLLQVWFWEVLWIFFSILTELGIMLSSKSHFSSYVPIQSRNG